MEFDVTPVRLSMQDRDHEKLGVVVFEGMIQRVGMSYEYMAIYNIFGQALPHSNNIEEHYDTERFAIFASRS